MAKKQLFSYQKYFWGKQMPEHYISNSNYNCVFGTFTPPIYTFPVAGNINICRPSQVTNREKYSFNKRHQRLNYRLWLEIKTFPYICSITKRVLAITRRKFDEGNQSKTAIKLVLSAPKSLFYKWNVSS